MYNNIWCFSAQRKVLLILTYPIPLSSIDMRGGETNVLIACPNPPKAAMEAGKAIALPGKVFGAKEILRRLPKGYRPDIVQISARDLSYRPRNLEEFQCPTVLKIGDTGHWGNGGLVAIVEYAKEINCDYHWCYQYPQHLHFFSEAGLSNVFWIPGTIGTPLPTCGQFLDRKNQVVFRGSLDPVHFRRKRLIEYLISRDIPVNTGRQSYQGSLMDYACSTISFNCSGNGDINRRIYEVLISGGFLLTDRLSIHSGLYTMFTEGVHIECYGSDMELLEKAKYYLRNPEKAKEIAENGKKLIMERYSPSMVREIFHNIIFSGKVPDSFDISHDVRAAFPRQEYQVLKKRMRIYELIQELQVANQGLQIQCRMVSDSLLLSDLSDLTRIKLGPSQNDNYDIIYCENANDAKDSIKNIKPGGLIAVDKNASIDRLNGFRKICLVDSMTRTTLAHDALDIYQSPGESDMVLNTKTLKDFFDPRKIYKGFSGI